MTEFAALIESQIAGSQIRVAPLALFDFKSGPVRLWQGFGDVVIDGFTWQGIGNMAQITNIESGIGQAATELTFQLYGSQGLLDNIEADSEDSQGREVTVYFQFFDTRTKDEGGNWVDWSPLDDPIAIFNGIMGPLQISRQPPNEAGVTERTITVRAVNAFLNRSRPRFSFFSDLDQKGRSGSDDDQIFSRIAAYSDGTIAWPSF